MNNAKIAIIKSYIKIILTYRGMMVINAIRLLLMPLALAAAWLSIEKTPGNPYSDGDYLLYYLLLPIIQNLTDSKVIFKFPMAIRDGTLNRELLKPFPPLLGYVFESIANNLIQLLYIIPFTLIAGIAFYDRLSLKHLSLNNLLTFFMAIIVGLAVKMAVSGAISLVGFWVENITTLNLLLNGGISALLGGMIVPVATFPEHIRNFAILLPYRYMLSFPIEVFSGRLSQSEIIYGFTVAFVWIALFAIIMRITWKKGLKTYTAYGG